MLGADRRGPAARSRRPTTRVQLASGLILSVALIAAGVVLIVGPRPAAQPPPPHRPAGSASAASRLVPGHLYAPYLANWANENLASVARASGVRYFRLAFLQTVRPGSCVLAWQGDPSLPVTASSLAAEVTQLQALGGGIIPAFGGFAAESDGTDIADSCTSVPAIATAYESVIARYSAPWIDLTVESAALADQAGIARRSAALALVQQWASAARRQVRIMVTFAGSQQGLNLGQLAVLASLKAHGVRLSAVDLLAYDYYDGGPKQPVGMAAAAMSGLQAVHAQLGSLYPGDSGSQLWSMLSVTLMPGIDDNAAKTEITSPADAARVLAFARQNGLAQVSIWSLDRDNGECPDTAASSTCSGISQSAWAFSHILEPYSGT